MRTILAIGLFLIGANAAQAECQPMPAPAHAGINFFMNIQPSDTPLDVWCRLQSLQGEYKVNVLFPNLEAHRTMMVKFDGRPTRGKIEFATFLQSLLPETDGDAVDDKGMAFRKVLEKSVQALATTTPDGEPLGLPATAPYAKEIAIWEPMTIRVAPLKIGGVDFTLEVRFRPTVGQFLLALNGRAEDLILKGYKANVMRGAGPGECNERIPECKALGDTVPLHTAWQLDMVRLSAAGEGLSGATALLFPSFLADNRRYVQNNNWSSFQATVGTAEIYLNDDVREARAHAEGDPKKASGSRTISIGWREIRRAKTTYSWSMEQYAKQVREAFALNRSTSPTQAKN